MSQRASTESKQVLERERPRTTKKAREHQLEKVDEEATTLATFELDRTPPPTSEEVELRKFSRIKAKVPISMFSENNFYAGISENISEGGIFISTYEHFSLGTQFELSISLPGNRIVKLLGEVKWVREYNDLTPEVNPGVGVQFIEMSADEQALMEEFIQSRSTMLYDA